MSSDFAKVIQCASEKLFISENGEGVSSRPLIALCFIQGGGSGFYFTRGRRPALDFSNDGQFSVGSFESATKRRRARERVIELHELGFRDGPDERSDFAPLPRHDLNEFIRHRVSTKNEQRWENETESYLRKCCGILRRAGT